MSIRIYTKCLLTLLLAALSFNASAERIKDLVSIAGVRSNQLLGYGLVVGLDGTGGKTKFAQQSLKNMLNRFGITVPANVSLTSKNVAAVAVHASLPAFVKPGQTIDITVSSLGDAKSLKGGTLVQTPLRGADRQVYAVAQGQLSVGGFAAGGGGASKKVNHIYSLMR